MSSMTPLENNNVPKYGCKTIKFPVWPIVNKISEHRLLFGCIWKDSYINGPKQSLTQFTAMKRIQLVGPVARLPNLDAVWLHEIIYDPPAKKC